MSEQSAPYSYDEVPYPSYPKPATHPDRLATLARLFGMNPAPPQRCRVLELGCGSGGNLIGMAYGLPGSSFVGLDLSARQVAMGQELVQGLELQNVTLRHMSILDVQEDFGEFDYIIAFGVYSWVPQEVKERIMALSSRHLAPQGVAAISYNTYPGWHMHGIIRDMMRYHTRFIADPETQAHQARAVLQFMTNASEELSKNSPTPDPYSLILRREHDRIEHSSDAYLLHEHLEINNDPVYFYQFAERAARNGLQYLGDAQFSSMVSGTLPPEVADTLERIAPNVVALEQYMDFLLKRTFRNTLLCHQELTLNRDLKPELLQHFWLSSAGQLVPPANDALPVPGDEQFRTPGDVLISAGNPLNGAALGLLVAAWPRAIPFQQLVADATAQVAADRLPSDDELAQNGLLLGDALLRSYTVEMVELHCYAPAVVSQASERPIASTLARLQATQGSTVTSMTHQAIDLSETDRYLLLQLDGDNDRPALLEMLERMIADGALELEADDALLVDHEQRRQVLAAMLEETLTRFARSGLLIG